MGFTAPVTRATDFLVTAAVWNAEHVDNFNTAIMHLIARKSADESVTSSTAHQADDHLILPVLANEVWNVRWQFIVTGATAGDIAIRFTFPASGTVGFMGFSVVTTTIAGAVFQGTTSPTTSRNFDLDGATLQNVIEIGGLYTNAGTAGNVTPEWAQATSNATATTVKANSTLWGVKLA